MVTKYLTAIETGNGNHFNEKSGLILLDGPRGPMLARYAEPMTPPDPDRFKFLTSYPRNYTTFDGGEPPDQAPADVCASAVPIDRTTDTRMGVSSGTTEDPVGGSVSNKQSVLIMPGMDQSVPLSKASGIEVNENRTEISGAEGAMSVGDKVRISGGFEQPQTGQKGVTKESPLFGIIPKTAVTFAAADYLPNLKKLQKMMQYVAMIRQIPKLVQSVIDVGKKLTN